MSAPRFIICGRVRSTGKAELRVAYSQEAYRTEASNMSEMLALPWENRSELSPKLVTLKWLKPSERRELSRRLKDITNLSH